MAAVAAARNGAARRASTTTLTRATVLLVALATHAGAAMQRAPADPADVVAKVAAYVESYYQQARSIVAHEAVLLQPLESDLSMQGFGRRLQYELRFEWDPARAEPATVVRELLDARGRPPGNSSDTNCFDPRAVSPEPLAFLLPHRRDNFTFTVAGTTRLDGRAAIMLDATPRTLTRPTIEWRAGDCYSVDLSGRTKGRIWADPRTGEVLRYDEHIIGQVDLTVPRARQRAGAPNWFSIDRADMSILYKPVDFADPPERLLLPHEIRTLAVVRNSGVPRLRTVQTFSNYRRFVANATVITGG